MVQSIMDLERWNRIASRLDSSPVLVREVIKHSRRQNEAIAVPRMGRETEQVGECIRSTPGAPCISFLYALLTTGAGMGNCIKHARRSIQKMLSPIMHHTHTVP